ncbi:MAG: HU family DNA-binding protein, partial [Ghiorsea sp.]
MTKSELIDAVALANGDITRKEAEFVVTTVFSAISEELANGGRVELRGFGSFSIKKRDARTGRNPKTGESVEVASK